MGYPSTPHEQKYVKSLAKPSPFPEWMLLRLPTGEYAAFWSQALETDYATAICESRYKDVCAHISKNKQAVLTYMAENQLKR